MLANVFPTHVGMNRAPSIWGKRMWSIPHTRGDEPIAAQVVEDMYVYSPHTWG